MIDDESLKSLERLHKLKTDGVITEAEFDAAKADLLTKPSAPRSSGATAIARPATPAMFDGTLPAEDDHLGWMLLPIRRYADFNGRSRRKEFWLFQLLIALITMGAFILAISDGPRQPWEEDGSGFGALALALWALAMLGLVIPMLAVQVRRLHDQDKVGWFALFNLIPYVGFIIALIFMSIDGTHGENQYGPDPLNR